MTQSNPRKQGLGCGGIAPPKERQFGQPNGNPRHNGAWKKENTLRYKWEKLLAMNEAELIEVLKDPKCGRVEQMTAEVLLDRRMKATEKIAVLDKLATQVYGLPKQVVEQTNIELKPILPKLEDKKSEKNE